MSNDQPSDGYDIIFTHTVRSKAYRYLTTHEIADCVRSPWQVYYDESRDTYLLRTDRQPDPKNFPPGTQPSKKNRIVLIVSVDDSSEEVVVITQTMDHYDWSNYEKVDTIEVPIAEDVM